MHASGVERRRGTGSAAQPTKQGCVAASVSANAQVLHPYGQVVLDPNAPRSDFGKVSDAVHAVQAGEVPDSIFPNTIFPNTCN